MPDKPKHSGLPPPSESLFDRLGEQFRLAWRLFQDNRVPIRVKLIPILGIAYIISPLGLIPELIPVIGQIDAIAVTLLIIAWFNYAAPRAVVDEHLFYLRSHARPMRRAMSDRGKIIIENHIHFTDESNSDRASDKAVDPEDSADVDFADSMDAAQSQAAPENTEPESDPELFTKQAQAKR